MSENAPKNKAIPLQLNNKQQEQQDATREALTRRCKVCKREVEPRMLCICGGGGGGSSGGGSGSGDTDLSCALDTPAYSLSTVDLIPRLDKEKISNNEDGLKDNLSSPLKEETLTFDLDVIAKLLAEEKLLIINDKENGILTIKCNPHLTFKLSDEETQELNNFIKFVENQFDKFNEKYSQGNFSKIISSDVNGNNSIVIKIGSPKLYDEFIQQLTDAIYRLSTVHNKAAVNLITTLLQDDHTISKDKKSEAMSQYRDFSSRNQSSINSAPKDAAVKHFITPFPTNLIKR